MNNIELIIRNLLDIYSMTQVDFALKTDIPLATIKKYLQGAFNPTIKNIEKLEKAFNLSLKKIMSTNLTEYDLIEDLIYFYKGELKRLKNEKETIDFFNDFIENDYANMQTNVEERLYYFLNETEENKVFFLFESYIDMKNGKYNFNFPKFYSKIDENKKNIEKIENTLNLLDTITKTFSYHSTETQILKTSDDFLEKLLNILSVKTTIENDSVTVEIEKEKFSLKLSEFKKITNMIKNDIKINIKKYIELIQYDNNKDK